MAASNLLSLQMLSRLHLPFMPELTLKSGAENPEKFPAHKDTKATGDPTGSPCSVYLTPLPVGSWAEATPAAWSPG